MMDNRAWKNAQIIGAGLGAGLPLEMVMPLCTPLKERSAPTRKALSEQDKARIAAAEEKRQRRAAKRAAAEIGKRSDGEGV